MQTRHECFAEMGAEAFAAGRPITLSEHVQDDEDRQSWETGWLTAKNNQQAVRPKTEKAKKALLTREENTRIRDGIDMDRFLITPPSTNQESQRCATLRKKYPEFGPKLEARRAEIREKIRNAEIKELRALHLNYSGEEQRRRYETLRAKYAHRSWGSDAVIDLWGFETARKLKNAIERRDCIRDQIASGDHRASTQDDLERATQWVNKLKHQLAEITGNEQTILEFRRMIIDEIFPENDEY
jgi:hypothetical protein